MAEKQTDEKSGSQMTRYKMKQSTFEELLDYRRAVSELYGRLRRSELSLAERCEQFRRERDWLFKNHPQAALSVEQKVSFSGLPYYPYDPAWRLDTNVEPDIIEVELQHDGRCACSVSAGSILR
jgi:uncharacterized protein (DUF1684 family)